MKPIFEKLHDTSELPIKVFHFKCPYFTSPWHFHDEYEIVMVYKSKGKRFIGNNIAVFDNINLVLLGPFLPHVYLNTPDYYKQHKNQYAESIVIHFSKEFLSKEYFNSNEMKPLNDLLKKSVQGIEFTGTVKNAVAKKLKSIINKKGLEKLTIFLSILNLLTKEKKYNLLSTTPFTDNKQGDHEQMDTVLKYIMNNYQKPITLHEVANCTNMSISAFCNFFKKRTQKTFIQYVNEVRITTACNLIIENELNYSQICYECGFSSITNFNRQFKKLMKKSPSQYKKIFIAEN